jgi:hypothetical protein
MARNDFNGDGLSDLFWQDWDGAIANWLGSGNGRFVANPKLMNDSASGGVVALGDFGGDGRSDALFGDRGTVTTLSGQADGSFVAQVLQARAAPGWWISAFGDFNGDGRTDLVWGRGTPSERAYSVWLATSEGDFALSAFDPYAPFPGAGTGPRLAGDFNGDGRDEVVWRDWEQGLVGVWSAGANGDLQIDFDNVVGTAPSPWDILDVGDFNGDGRDDLLWQIYKSGLTSVWLGTADGGFVHDPTRQNHADPSWFFGDVGDYNGDGRDDILWRNTQGHIAEWLSDPNVGFVVNPTDHIVDNSMSAWFLMPWW